MHRREHRRKLACQIVWIVALVSGLAGAQQQSVATRKIHLNTATAKQLETLPYIGPKRAAAIMEYRKRIGGFTRITQLLRIKGIGKKTLARLQPLVSISRGVQATKEPGCPVRDGLCSAP